MAATATFQFTFPVVCWSNNIVTTRVSQALCRAKSFICRNAIHQTEFDSLYVMRKTQFPRWLSGAVSARVAILANLSPDSENLANESIWLQMFWFGELANFWRFLKNLWLQIFWFGEIDQRIIFCEVFSQNELQCHLYVDYTLYICTHLLTYPYIGLLF